jgi:hypothetical protein
MLHCQTPAQTPSPDRPLPNKAADRWAAMEVVSVVVPNEAADRWAPMDRPA